MNKRHPKTARTFECRDHLWNLFTFVADDLGCTVDYLVNESMREYARSRGYSITQAIRLNDESSEHEDQTVIYDEPESQAIPDVINPPEAVVYPKRLFVDVNGSEVEVSGSQFVIGRGSRLTDLTIPDTNISRRHCIIEAKDDAFFISDLGSTNGIEVGGTRVAQAKIEQNMAVYICDYELRFTFRD